MHLVNACISEAREFKDSGVVEGKPYFYQVTAVDRVGLESDYNPMLFAAAYNQVPLGRLSIQLLPNGNMAVKVIGGIG